jgi:hypothetical protein
MNEDDIESMPVRLIATMTMYSVMTIHGRYTVKRDELWVDGEVQWLVYDDAQDPVMGEVFHEVVRIVQQTLGVY